MAGLVRVPGLLALALAAARGDNLRTAGDVAVLSSSGFDFLPTFFFLVATWSALLRASFSFLVKATRGTGFTPQEDGEVDIMKQDDWSKTSE
jgi:hypothetical protein